MRTRNGCTLASSASLTMPDDLWDRTKRASAVAPLSAPAVVGRAAVDAALLWSRRPGQDECHDRYRRPTEQNRSRQSISKPVGQA